MTDLARRTTRADCASIASSTIFEADVGDETKLPHRTAPFSGPPPVTVHRNVLWIYTMGCFRPQIAPAAHSCTRDTKQFELARFCGV